MFHCFCFLFLNMYDVIKAMVTVLLVISYTFPYKRTRENLLNFTNDPSLMIRPCLEIRERMLAVGFNKI